MANQKISELTQTSSLGELDLIPIAHYNGPGSYETQSTTFSSLKSGIVGSSGAITKLVYEDGDEAIYTSGDTLYLYNDSGNKVAYLNPISNENPSLEPDPNFVPESKLAIGTSSKVEGIIKFSNRNKVAATTTTQAKVLSTKFDLSDIGFRLTREEYTGSTHTGAWQLRMNTLDSYMYSKNHVEITAGSKTIDSKLDLSDLLTSTEADTEVRIKLLSGGDIFNTARDAIYFTAPVFHVKNGNEDSVFTITATDTTLQDASQGNILSQHYDSTNTANNTIKLSRGGASDVLEQNKTQTFLRDSNGDNFIYVYNDTDIENNTLNITRSGNNDVLTQSKNNTYLLDSNGKWLLNGYFDGSDAANNTLTLSRGDANKVLTQDKASTFLIDSEGDKIIQDVLDSTNKTQDLFINVDGNLVLSARSDYSGNANDTISISRVGDNIVLSQTKTTTLLNDSMGGNLLTGFYDGSNAANNKITLSRGGVNNVLKQDKETTILYSSDGLPFFQYAIDSTTKSSVLEFMKGGDIFLQHVTTSSGSSILISRSWNQDFLVQDDSSSYMFDSTGSSVIYSSYDGSDVANNTLTLSRGGANDVLSQDKDSTSLNASSGTPIIKHYELSVESIPCCDLDLSVYNSNVVKARVLTQDTSYNWITISRPGNNEILNQDKYSTKLYGSNSAALITHTVGAGVQYSADGANYFKLYNNAITVSQPVTSSSTIRATGLAATVQTLTDAASIAWDAAAGTNAIITLTAAGRTLANPTNIVAGTVYRLTVNQDATGGRTISTWGSYFKFPGGVLPTLTSTASACDVLEFYADTTTTLRLTNFIADSK